MNNKKFFSLNLHLDSLGESYGWPKNYKQDKTFSLGLKRISKIIKKYKVPITIFVIGKDLENNLNVNLLKKFINENDVEIANHSYNHFLDLGSKNYDEIYDEIYKSHEIISKKLNITVKGFCSPTWTYSKNIINVLQKLNYNYDTSNFNSLWLYPMLGKIFIDHIFSFNFLKSFKLLKRKDYLLMLKYKDNPYFISKKSQDKLKKKILEIPMPSINKFKVPNWHTIGFMFGVNFQKKQIFNFMNKSNFLNYIIHPADILINQDLDNRYVNSLTRLENNNLRFKISYFENIIKICKNNNFNFIKMNDYSKYFIKNNKTKKLYF